MRTDTAVRPKRRPAAQHSRPAQVQSHVPGLSDRVRKCRGGLTCEQFAVAVGVVGRTIERYERGHREGGAMDVGLALAICKASGCDVSWLLTGRGQGPKAVA